MIGAARAPRKPSPFDFQLPVIIKTPHALPMYKEETQKWVATTLGAAASFPFALGRAVLQTQLHGEGEGTCSSVVACAV
jgi:hypothetical protein